MYNPGTFEFSPVHDDMNVCGPEAHQRVISKLNSGLGPLFYREHTIQLEPLPETMLDDGQASPVSDLILYDNEAQLTPIIIKICHSEDLRKDFKKVITLLESDDYGIRERFVYDYVASLWFRYTKGDGGLTQSASFTEILQLDLNQFL